MRTGRRLALDIGKARIGVAVSDFHGILASPVGFCVRGTSIEETIANWRAFVAQHEELVDVEFLEAYVGLPVALTGTDTASTKDAIETGIAICAASGIEARFIDERLTTVSASAALRSSGIDSRKGRGMIDSVAATIILEQALATEKAQGVRPGRQSGEVTDGQI